MSKNDALYDLARIFDAIQPDKEIDLDRLVSAAAAAADDQRRWLNASMNNLMVPAKEADLRMDRLLRDILKALGRDGEFTDTLIYPDAVVRMVKTEHAVAESWRGWEMPKAVDAWWNRSKIFNELASSAMSAKNFGASVSSKKEEEGPEPTPPPADHSTDPLEAAITETIRQINACDLMRIGAIVALNEHLRELLNIRVDRLSGK